MKVELTENELFLIEMAIDQTMYCIPDINSPLYKRFEQIDQKVFGLRKSEETSESAETGKLNPELAQLDDIIKELSNLLHRTDLTGKQIAAIKIGVKALVTCEEKNISLLTDFCV